jgi:hypothetical protein
VEIFWRVCRTVEGWPAAEGLALGLTVSLLSLPRGGAWADGLVLAVLLALLVRPLLVGLVRRTPHCPRRRPGPTTSARTRRKPGGPR